MLNSMLKCFRLWVKPMSLPCNMHELALLSLAKRSAISYKTQGKMVLNATQNAAKRAFYAA